MSAEIDILNRELPSAIGPYVVEDVARRTVLWHKFWRQLAEDVLREASEMVSEEAA